MSLTTSAPRRPVPADEACDRDGGHVVCRVYTLHPTHYTLHTTHYTLNPTVLQARTCRRSMWPRWRPRRRRRRASGPNAPRPRLRPRLTPPWRAPRFLPCTVEPSLPISLSLARKARNLLSLASLSPRPTPPWRARRCRNPTPCRQWSLASGRAGG